MNCDQESLLIDAVRDCTALYDKRAEGYHKRKDNIWDQIALKINSPGIDGVKCNRAWTSLRSQFMAHRRKLRQPTGSAKKRRPYFRHEEAMEFLIGTLDEDEVTYSNVPSPVDTAQNIEQENHELPTEGTSSDHDTTPQPHSPVNEEGYRIHKKFGQKRKIDSFDESLLNYLKSSDDKDEYATFGELVALKLRRIGERDRKAALLLQQSINNEILKAELQDE